MPVMIFCVGPRDLIVAVQSASELHKLVMRPETMEDELVREEGVGPGEEDDNDSSSLTVDDGDKVVVAAVVVVVVVVVVIVAAESVAAVVVMVVMGHLGNAQPSSGFRLK